MFRPAFDKCAVINSGTAAWAFADFATDMARALNLDVVDISDGLDFAYVVAWDKATAPSCPTFIPFESMQIASDKRATASAFAAKNVPRPTTYLLETREEIKAIIAESAPARWVLKWPIGCGGTGHREITLSDHIDAEWPVPFVLQRFIEMDEPQVHRLYCVAGHVFGWNRRRFPTGVAQSPWVAHARGAVYDDAGPLPHKAKCVGIEALRATGLLHSFGCVDMLRTRQDEWLALEVGTDGLLTHVDRDISIPGIASEIQTRLVEAFFTSYGRQKAEDN
jgi:hypothetical protein